MATKLQNVPALVQIWEGVMYFLAYHVSIPVQNVKKTNLRKPGSFTAIENPVRFPRRLVITWYVMTMSASTLGNKHSVRTIWEKEPPWYIIMIPVLEKKLNLPDDTDKNPSFQVSI